MGHCPKMFSDFSGARALLESVKVQRSLKYSALVIKYTNFDWFRLNICENFVQNFRDLQD